MDDIIVRVARTVACLTRLRILSLLARTPELTPTALAAELGIRLDTVCVHLNRLAAVGLILRRHSGRYCYSRAGSPYSDTALSGRISACLHQLLGNPDEAANSPAVSQLRDCPAGDGESVVRHQIFEAATAFANHRRLQILRRLATSGPATVRTLGEELNMSAAALSRHLTKLERRGYLTITGGRRGASYQLCAEGNTPIHGQLFEIVRLGWDRR